MYQLVLTSTKDLKQIAVDQRDIAKEQLKVAQNAAQERLSDQQKKCLQLFRLTKSDKDATYESYKERVEDRVEGTCTWVLRHDNFKAWRKKDTGPLLISADPGCGKSVLAKFLTDDVLPKSSPGSTICYFFFEEQNQNTVRQALCALLHQLFCKNPVLVTHAMDNYTKEGEGLIDSVLSLRAIFNRVVQDPTFGSLIIVLDALDECLASELPAMLENIEKQCHKSEEKKGKLKYILTSRPYEKILSTFRRFFDDSSNIRIPGEDESETISQEVNLVIKYRVDKLAKEKELAPDVKEKLAKQLLEIPHRTYLWVYLVFDFLRDDQLKKTKQGVEKATRTLPKSVNAAYNQILSKSKDERMVHKVVAIILAAERPLTIAEMNVAINVEVGSLSLIHI